MAGQEISLAFNCCSFDSANEEDEDDPLEEKPDFLPMFPWYSGTSADMYRTMFDMLISLKLFLGRYDMRQMQVHYGKLASACINEAPLSPDF